MTYDHWKTTDPSDCGHPCDHCESDEARYDWHEKRWLCDRCQDDEDLAAIEAGRDYDGYDAWCEETYR